MGNCTRALLGIASFRLASLVRATEQAVPGKAAGVPGYELHEKWDRKRRQSRQEALAGAEEATNPPCLSGPVNSLSCRRDRLRDNARKTSIQRIWVMTFTLLLPPFHSTSQQLESWLA